MHEQHRQRVKERFLKENGIDSFAEHQALEMLLFYAIPRKDTNELAHELLNTFGSIKKLFAAKPEDIAKVKGIGINTAILIKLVGEMNKYYQSKQDTKKKYMRSIAESLDVITPLLFDKGKENVYIFCLNSGFQLMHYELVNKGDFNNVQFSVREVAEIAFRQNTELLILAHNHPAGSAFPSVADFNSTAAIAKALAPMGIKLVDHFIISENDYFSFSEQKMLEKHFKREDIKAAHYTGAQFKDK